MYAQVREPLTEHAVDGARIPDFLSDSLAMAQNAPARRVHLRFAVKGTAKVQLVLLGTLREIS